MQVVFSFRLYGLIRAIHKSIGIIQKDHLNRSAWDSQMFPGQSRWIPREGLYVDPVANFVRYTIFNPIITGVLGLFLYGNCFPKALNEASKDTGLIFFKWLWRATCAGTMLWCSEFLSRWMRNNWTKAISWKPKDQIVVVTGGSGGIGASAAKMLVEKGAIVVVLDVIPPSLALRMHAQALVVTSRSQFQGTVQFIT